MALVLNEIEGNAWNYDRQNTGIRLCITTNGTIKDDGSIVTGAGIAQEATEKYPSFPHIAGRFVRESGLHVYYVGFGLISFPVKHQYFDKAQLGLISYSIQELLLLTALYQWEQVIVPRPGCGNGQLNWPEVKEVILKTANKDSVSQTYMQKLWFVTNFSVEKQRNKKV